MAEDTPRSKVPTFDELLWPTIKALKATGGSASNEELLAKVIEIEGYPEEVQSFAHTDHRQTKLNYNLAWAKSYLKRAKALENSTRGIWSLSELGEQMTEADCKGVPAKVRREDQQRRREDRTQDVSRPSYGRSARGGKLERRAVELASGDGALRVRAAKSAATTGGRLHQFDVTGRSGDGGIDGVGVLRLNLLSFQVLFQCKRYKTTVGPGEVRDFRGVMVGRCDKGLMITTGVFSAEAKREATRDGAPAIDLIDGDLLCDLLKQLNLGVGTEMVEQPVIDPDWFSKM
jgi:restriction system protein